MNQETVVDVMVILEGQNPSFLAYMVHDEALRLQSQGLATAEQIHLRETPDRIIPDVVKKGESAICDIWVKTELEAGKLFYLN